MSEDGFWAIIGLSPAITNPEAAAQHVTEVAWRDEKREMSSQRLIRDMSPDRKS